MKLNNISLPYPVLGIQDDIGGKFSATIKIEKVKRAYSVTVNYILTNVDIEQLVADGKAEYLCEIKCAATKQRVCVSSSEATQQFSIPSNWVCGDIEFSFFVVVTESIIDYSNGEFNEDYLDYTFNLEPGDFLAITHSVHYDAEIEYHRLHALSSFMRIAPGGEDDTEIQFLLNKPYITITLPRALYDDYNEVTFKRPERAAMVHASIVNNALLYALYNMKGDNSEKLWARTIRHKVAHENEFKGLSLDNPEDFYLIANGLLKDPFNRMIEQLKEQ